MADENFGLTANNYEDFLRQMKTRIRRAQVKAALAVNRELIFLYWQSGGEGRTQTQTYGHYAVDATPYEPVEHTRAWCWGPCEQALFLPTGEN